MAFSRATGRGISVSSGLCGIRGAVAVAGEEDEDFFLAFRELETAVASGTLAQIWECGSH